MTSAFLMVALLAATPVPVVEVGRTPLEVVKAYLDLRDPSAGQLRDLCTDDVEWQGTGVEAPRVGLAAMAQMLGQSESMLPDARYEVISMAVDRDRVFVETRTSGTVRSAPRGAPDSVVGHYVDLRTVNVFELEGGRIRRITAYFDQAAYRRQLGLK